VVDGWTMGDDGVAVVRGAVPVPVRAAVREVLGRGVDVSDPASCIRPNNVLVPLHWHDEVVGLLLADPAVLAAVRRACGATDLRWISGYVSVRAPGTGPLPWHQDWWCWDHAASYEEPPPQVAVLCYVEDVAPERAALRVVPGSHRRPEVVADRTDPVTGAVAGEVDDGVVVPAGAGDVVVLDYRTLHGTTANATDRGRDVVILNFAPHWASLPADVRGHLVSHHSLPQGDAVVPPGHPVIPLLPPHTGPRRDLWVHRRPRGETAVAGAS
jgi:ectoine hydroxylase-related dioxygenase (phytanoyl-CoA dioxygenase family)